MVEVRQGGSSREAATANKLTPRPLFNLTLHLMPGLEKIWGCCSCHLSPPLSSGLGRAPGRQKLLAKTLCRMKVRVIHPVSRRSTKTQIG